MVWKIAIFNGHTIGLDQPLTGSRVNSVLYKVGPPFDSVQLVNITTITRVYGRQITIVRWGYKPTNITFGGPTL